MLWGEMRWDRYVGWGGVKRGEYGRILSWNWHVGGAVNEYELEFNKNDHFSIITLLSRSF